MKPAICALATLMLALPVMAKSSGGGGGSHAVRGHFNKNGTYVAPHHATNPNHTKRDNWSTQGNVNPYTGKPGNKQP